ncbi:MAG: hypothetical protein V4504_01320 [Patescibacteria group bacterium]
MKLAEVEEQTLIKQGLKEDIRNQLTPVKNIPSLFQAWKDEEDLAKKATLLVLLETEVGKLQPIVDHICTSLDYYDVIETKPETHERLLHKTFLSNVKILKDYLEGELKKSNNGEAILHYHMNNLVTDKDMLKVVMTNFVEAGWYVYFSIKGGMLSDQQILFRKRELKNTFINRKRNSPGEYSWIEEFCLFEPGKENNIC